VGPGINLKMHATIEVALVNGGNGVALITDARALTGHAVALIARPPAAIAPGIGEGLKLMMPTRDDFGSDEKIEVTVIDEGAQREALELRFTVERVAGGTWFMSVDQG
jgi:hypothetical protein